MATLLGELHDPFPAATCFCGRPTTPPWSIRPTPCYVLLDEPIGAGVVSLMSLSLRLPIPPTILRRPTTAHWSSRT